LVITFCFLPLAHCVAPFTTVTATVTDSDGQAWINCSWSVTFIPSAAYPNASTYNYNGVSFTSPTYNSYLQQNGSCDGTGSFSVTLLDNVASSPFGGTWRFTIKPNASVAATVYNSLAVSGTSVNLSSFLSTNSIAPRFSASRSADAYGYSDTEVSPTPVPGGQYFNVITATTRQWTGTIWQSIIGGTGAYLPIGGGTLLGPLTLNGDPTTSLQAATKHYVDTQNALYALLSGANFSGAVNTLTTLNNSIIIQAIAGDVAVPINNAIVSCSIPCTIVVPPSPSAYTISTPILVRFKTGIKLRCDTSQPLTVTYTTPGTDPDSGLYGTLDVSHSPNFEMSGCNIAAGTLSNIGVNMIHLFADTAASVHNFTLSTTYSPTISGILGVRVESATATITNSALTSNVITITASNLFFPGQTVIVTGSTNLPFINGIPLTVTSGVPGVPASTFTANFTHANVASAVDTGAVGDPSSTGDEIYSGTLTNIPYIAVSTGDYGNNINFHDLVINHPGQCFDFNGSGNGQDSNQIIYSRNTCLGTGDGFGFSFVESAANIIISDNVFYQIGGAGTGESVIESHCITNCAGQFEPVLIANNMFQGTPTTWYGVHVFQNASGTQINNNSFIGMGRDAVELDTGGGTPPNTSINNNFMFNNGSSWTAATITNDSWISNVGAFTATNTYFVGENLVFSGLTNLSFLNGLTLTVTVASGSSFSVTSAAVTHGNVSAAADSGTITSGFCGVRLKGAVSFANINSNYSTTGSSTQPYIICGDANSGIFQIGAMGNQGLINLPTGPGTNSAFGTNDENNITIRSTIISGSNSVPVTGSPTVGQASCIKSSGPPIVIGYCSTVVGAGGACTCN